MIIDNVQHPTYKALTKLGKTTKTILLSRYLDSRHLHLEIHEQLNVVEQWNGATDFVFFALRGEHASNWRKDLETSMLALHLFQICMLYINTLLTAHDIGGTDAAFLDARESQRLLQARHEQALSTAMIEVAADDSVV